MKLKAISLNIWEGNFLDQAISFFKTEAADLVLLQEVYGLNDQAREDRFRTLEVLKETLGFSDFDYVPGIRHNRKEGMFLQAMLYCLSFLS